MIHPAVRYHRLLQLHRWASCTATVLKWWLIVGAVGVGGHFAGLAAGLVVATGAREVVCHLTNEQLRRRLPVYRAIDVDELEAEGEG